MIGKIGSKVASKIRSVDRFAPKVSLTFNKSEGFETIVGGLGTLAMYLIVMMIGIVLLIEMFKKTSISATQTFIYRNLENSNDTYQISKDGVAFGMRVFHQNGTIADETIGTFRVEERAYIGYPEKDSLQRNASIVNQIELEPCNEDSDFGKINWYEGNSKMKCFKHNNYSVGGREYSYSYYILLIYFERCSGLLTWRPLAEIEDFINKSTFMVSIANQYFDFNNIEKPVQYFMDSYLDVLNADKTKMGMLKARKNQYTLNDALFYGDPVKKDHFFSIHEDSRLEFALLGLERYYQLSIRYDPRIEVYERTLKNSIDVLGDIGGIFEIVHILLMIPISFVSRRLLKREV